MNYYVASRGILSSCDYHSTNPISSIRRMAFYPELKTIKTMKNPTIYVCNSAMNHFNTIVPYIDFSIILNALSNLEKAAAHVEQAKASADVNKINNLNAKIFAAEQQLLSSTGLPRRPWFKHTIYAPGFYTGYGVKTVPGVREAIEQKNWAEAKEQINQVANAIEKLSSYLDAL